MMSEVVFGAIFGVLLTSAVCLFGFNYFESKCERKYDVYDCEIAAEPFVPSKKGVSND